MTRLIDWKVLGSALGCFLAINYFLWVSFGLLFDTHMYRAWADLLPGFHSLPGGSSFVLGLVATIAYSRFFSLLFAPLHNIFQVKIWRRTS